MDEMAVFAVSSVAASFTVAGFILGLIWKQRIRSRGNQNLHRVIGIDGDNYVIMQMTVDGRGSKHITLVDQGTFEREHWRD